MPTAILAIAGYAISGGVTMTVGAATWTISYATIINTVALAAAATFAARALAPDVSAQRGLGGYQDNLRVPDEPRRIIYGRQKVGGVLAFIHSTGNDNYNLHLVIVIADHECDALEKIYFNDDEVAFNATSGAVTTGRYAGKARILWRSGTDTQTAIPELVSECSPKWTTDHRLRGIAYLYVRLIYKPETYPTGIPVVSALVRGKKIFDLRTNTTGWSRNPALCARDYLTNTRHGLGVEAGDLDADTFAAAANLCDESVTLDAGGTETRYTANGILSSSARPEDNIGQLLTSCGGLLIYTGGKWAMHAAGWRAPAYTITQDQLAGPVVVKTRLSARDRCNAVKGTYISPDTNWQSADFPAYAPAEFLTADANVRAWRDIALPFTTSSATAQRLAKIELLRARQEITVELVCQLHAMRLRTGDVVNLTLPRYGWTTKPFEVTGWIFDQVIPSGGGDTAAPAPLVRLSLRETSSSIYGWTPSTDEAGVDPAPNTDLPGAILVTAPGSFAGTSDTIQQSDGTIVARFNLTWNTPLDPFTGSSAGRIEIQTKLSAEATWKTVAMFPGDSDSATLIPYTPGLTYDLRIRGINPLGSASPWQALTNRVAAGDTTAPAAPSALSVLGIFTGVRLRWGNPADTDFSFVEVFEGTTATPAPDAASTPYARINGTEFIRQGITIGETRWYWVRSVDTSGNRSAWAGGVSGVSQAVDTGQLTGQITATQITDGAISTPKLAANSIIAEKVGTNEIITTSANIANLAVTSAKINDVSADKITAGTISSQTINVAGGTSGVIQSSNFVAGSAGWRIRGNGDAEFNTVTIRVSDSVSGTGSNTVGDDQAVGVCTTPAKTWLARNVNVAFAATFANSSGAATVWDITMRIKVGSSTLTERTIRYNVSGGSIRPIISVVEPVSAGSRQYTGEVFARVWSGGINPPAYILGISSAIIQAEQLTK